MPKQAQATEMLVGLGAFFGQTIGLEVGPSKKDDEVLLSYDPSLGHIEKFEGKNVLITGATGGIGN